MADPTKENPQKLAKRRLKTLGDVQRALAKLAMKVERNKAPDLEKANTLRGIYQSLALLMQDRRDSRYKARLRVLWEAHNKRGPQALEQESH